ncbi:hypothetical protein PN36_32590, partial [Candidatus Thiomargarita nelsonii]
MIKMPQSSTASFFLAILGPLSERDESFHDNSLSVDTPVGATRVLDGLSHPIGDNALARFASPFEREATDVALYRVTLLE